MWRWRRWEVITGRWGHEVGALMTGLVSLWEGAPRACTKERPGESRRRAGRGLPRTYTSVVSASLRYFARAVPASKRHGVFSLPEIISWISSWNRDRSQEGSSLIQSPLAKSLISHKNPMKSLHYNINEKNGKLSTTKTANQKIHLYLINNRLQRNTRSNRRCGINVGLLHWAET